MSFNKTFTLQEVKGLLTIYRGNHAVVGLDPLTGRIKRAPAPAHAHIHGGANFLEQKARVNTPGQPRQTSTYCTEHDQALATLEILNSPAGKAAIKQLFTGSDSVVIKAKLAPNRYATAVAHDASHTRLGRHNQGRLIAGATHRQCVATTGFVKLVRGVGGLFQIQTSFPICA